MPSPGLRSCGWTRTMPTRLTRAHTWADSRLTFGLLNFPSTHFHATCQRLPFNGEAYCALLSSDGRIKAVIGALTFLPDEVPLPLLSVSGLPHNGRIWGRSDMLGATKSSGSTGPGSRWHRAGQQWARVALRALPASLQSWPLRGLRTSCSRSGMSPSFIKLELSRWDGTTVPNPDSASGSERYSRPHVGVSSWPNNVSAAHIACRTHMAFTSPSHCFYQDLAFVATVDLRLYPILRSEALASVPACTVDMRASSCWVLALSMSIHIIMRPSGDALAALRWS